MRQVAAKAWGRWQEYHKFVGRLAYFGPLFYCVEDLLATPWPQQGHCKVREKACIHTCAFNLAKDIANTSVCTERHLWDPLLVWLASSCRANSGMRRATSFWARLPIRKSVALKRLRSWNHPPSWHLLSLVLLVKLTMNTTLAAYGWFAILNAVPAPSGLLKASIFSALSFHMIW